MALSVTSVPTGVSVQTAPQIGNTGSRFAEILSDTFLFNKGFGGQLHQSVQEMQGKISAGTPINLREMISYQIKAGQLGLHVELISKVAESALTTVRKLQANQ